MSQPESQVGDSGSSSRRLNNMLDITNTRRQCTFSTLHPPDAVAVYYSSFPEACPAAALIAELVIKRGRKNMRLYMVTLCRFVYLTIGAISILSITPRV